MTLDVAVGEMPETPAWWRGPVDPTRYRLGVALDLRWMRMQAGLTQMTMARKLGVELGRRIPDISVSRWETGAKCPGADVYVAYLRISGAPRPTDIEGRDYRLRPELRVAQMEERLAELEELLANLGSLVAAPTLADADEMITATEAMELAHVSRQAIHDWVAAKQVRGSVDGHRLRVSKTDIMTRIRVRSENRR